MSTTRLATPVSVTVGPATLVGRIWRSTPLIPWSGDTTSEANTCRTRNSGKTRDARVWLGIRYAQPPVGSRRWYPPVDYDYPAGTWQCDKFGNVCHQVYGAEESGNGRPEWGVTVGAADLAMRDDAPESEDCLFLNIYRPNGSPPTGGFPVVFWMHGGGHVFRSGNEPHERGHRLCQEGVIVVTPTYRLSNFGYHFHPDFEAEPGWEGPNFGYSDCKSALRWVNRNISAFGGDPARVLVGGSSAGGVYTLGMLEDASTQALFSAAWISSGGGIGERFSKTITSGTMGYADRHERFHRAVRGVAGSMRDYSQPSRTLSAAMAAGNEGQALRMGLSPSAIMAFSDARNRLIFPNWNLGTAQYSASGSENVYPFRGNGLAEYTAIDAACRGKFTKPFVDLTSEHEASAQPGYTSWTAATASNWLRLAGVPSYEDWSSQSWQPGWSEAEKKRQVYTHVIWHYPAWKIVREAAHVTASSPGSYLLLWGFASGAASHSSDVPYIFGNVEWNAGMSGSEAQVTERMLRMSVGMQKLIVNMAYSGNPNTAAPVYSGSWSLFSSPPVFSLVSYSNSLANNWNIAGHTVAMGGGSAPVQITHEPYLPGAWSYYNGWFRSPPVLPVDEPPTLPPPNVWDDNVGWTD